MLKNIVYKKCQQTGNSEDSFCLNNSCKEIFKLECMNCLFRNHNEKELNHNKEIKYIPDIIKTFEKKI